MSTQGSRPLSCCAAFVLVSLWAAGCGQNPPAPAPAPPKAAAPATPYNAYVHANTIASLHPALKDPPTTAEQAQAVWRGMSPGLIADEKSKALMRRLHGDLATELAYVDSKQADFKSAMVAPPSAGFNVAYRISDTILSVSKLKPGTDPVPTRAMEFSQVIRIENAATKSAPNMNAAAQSMADEFKDFHPVTPLFLVMEDYILRHAPGWVLDRSYGETELKTPTSIEEQRRDLDRRIEEYAQRAKVRYDALQKPR